MSEPMRQRVLNAATGYELLALDREYIGSCPCAKIEDEADGLTIEMNCWRVRQWYAVENRECHHDYACAHLWGADNGMTAHVKRLLDDMYWYGEWEVEQESARLSRKEPSDE